MESKLFFSQQACWTRGTGLAEACSISAAAAWPRQMLGDRDSSEHYELLSSTLPTGAHGKYFTIDLKLQIQTRACLGHFFYSHKIKVSLFLIMGSLSKQEQWLAQKWWSCECPKAYANFYNGFDRKIKGSDLLSKCYLYIEWFTWKEWKKITIEK